MKTVILALAALPWLQASERLVLSERAVTLKVADATASVTWRFKVRNPGLKAGEGEIELRAPAGAAVYEVRVEELISARDRCSRPLEARRAQALYDEGKRIEKSADELSETLARAGRRNQTPTPVVLGNDPALVEESGKDRYRLRFHPVPALGEQTVSVTLAVGAERVGDHCRLLIPLELSSNLSSEAARSEIRVDLASSSKTGAGVSSATHALPLGTGARYSAVLAGEGKEFAVEYRAGPAAAGEKDRAVRALAARRSMEGLDEAARLRVSLEAGIVSSQASLLVIERSLRREAERNLPEARPIAPDEAKTCDLVRAEAGLPSLKRQGPCEVRVITTNDAARLAWARAQGLELREARGKSGFAFELARHDWACRLGEASPLRLKAAAQGLR
jgi:hypothetical protein